MTCKFISKIQLPDTDEISYEMKVRLSRDRYGLTRSFNILVYEDITLHILREKLQGKCRAFIDDFHFCTNKEKKIAKDKEGCVVLSDILPRALPVIPSSNNFKFGGLPYIWVRVSYFQYYKHII